MPDKTGQLLGRFLQGVMGGYMTGTQMARQRRQDQLQQRYRAEDIARADKYRSEDIARANKQRQEDIDWRNKVYEDAQADKDMQAMWDIVKYNAEQDKATTRHKDLLAAAKGGAGMKPIDPSKQAAWTKVAASLGIPEGMAPEVGATLYDLSLQKVPASDLMVIANQMANGMLTKQISQGLESNPDIAIQLDKLNHPSGDKDIYAAWIKGADLANLLEREYGVPQSSLGKYLEKETLTQPEAISLLQNDVNAENYADIFSSLMNPGNNEPFISRVIGTIFGESEAMKDISRGAKAGGRFMP